jgi:hypothetical protein
VDYNCKHKCPYKREPKEDYTTCRKGKGNVKVEEAIRMTGPKAKE